MKKMEKGMIIFAIGLLLALVIGFVLKDVDAGIFRDYYEQRRRISAVKTENAQFLNKMDNCVAYKGHVYFMIKGYSVSRFHYQCKSAEDISPDMIPEGYEYVGELTEDSKGERYFHGSSMLYKTYAQKGSQEKNDNFYFPSGAEKGELYYNAEKDSCFAVFSNSSYGYEDGVVWLKRDDSRLDYNMIRDFYD